MCGCGALKIKVYKAVFEKEHNGQYIYAYAFDGQQQLHTSNYARIVLAVQTGTRLARGDGVRQVDVVVRLSAAGI